MGILDVRNNCWGLNFNPEEDLYTGSGEYLWNPIWCPGPPPPPPDGEDDERMYSNGDSLFSEGAYSQAKDTFQLLIDQYPHSQYSSSALKELFRLEQFAGDDYLGLQQYYLTNDSILSDSILAVTGDFLSNKCSEKLENLSSAINWYENVIMNPPSLEDSIFAIIDLGNLYFMMGNSGSKSTYVGALAQYKFDDKKIYRQYRDSLLAMLPGDQKQVISRSCFPLLKRACYCKMCPTPLAALPNSGINSMNQHP